MDTRQAPEREFYAALGAILLLAAVCVFLTLGVIPSFGLIPD